MKPVIDLTKEYGLVLEGGGARGAYQIGAWEALAAAGVKINAIAGTSVGALNGALICMNDLARAKGIWQQITFSKVMQVDDEWMEQFMDNKLPPGEVFARVWKEMAAGGVDVTPLRRLIRTTVDEDQVRKSPIDFYLLTFSVSDLKELDLNISDIPAGRLEDFLLASAYLLGFKREKLHGKVYMDGGVFNNVPVNSLVNRGYKDLIEIRIYGPGREPKVKLPPDGVRHVIAPNVRLGSILEFSAKRSRQNLTIGYYDAQRMLYGLAGSIYYIDQDEDEAYFTKMLADLSFRRKRELAFALRLPLGADDREIFLALLEASAKQLRIKKYRIYTTGELLQSVRRRYEKYQHKEELPEFVELLAELGKDKNMNLKGRNFLTLKDYTPEEILYLLDLARELKDKKKEGLPGASLLGKNIALIFEKPSTRTRCAFTVAAADEGGMPVYLAGSEIQLGHKESIEDTARVLGRMFDGIEFRGFRQSDVEALAKYSGVPVWNGLTDEYHPTQILADLLTMQEHFGRLAGLNFVYLGDGRNNMANSLMIGCAKVGVNFTIIAPAVLWPSAALVDQCQEYAKASGALITISDQTGDVAGADVLYTDVWASMGEEDQARERITMLEPYQINRELMAATGKAETIFMHCLPAVKGHEVTAEVFDSPASVVFDEAENRLHTIKAVMVATLGE